MSEIDKQALWFVFWVLISIAYIVGCVFVAVERSDNDKNVARVMFFSIVWPLCACRRVVRDAVALLPAKRRETPLGIKLLQRQRERVRSQVEQPYQAGDWMRHD